MRYYCPPSSEEIMGCTSVDGTYVVFAPDLNLGRMTRWVARVEREGRQSQLWDDVPESPAVVKNPGCEPTCVEARS